MAHIKRQVPPRRILRNSKADLPKLFEQYFGISHFLFMGNRSYNYYFRLSRSVDDFYMYTRRADFVGRGVDTVRECVPMCFEPLDLNKDGFQTICGDLVLEQRNHSANDLDLVLKPEAVSAHQEVLKSFSFFTYYEVVVYCFIASETFGVFD
jgi:hypothetical protein